MATPVSDECLSGKNIILCFDGTDNTFGPNPFSNVLKVYRMLDSSNYEKQICYYQPGIGTSLVSDNQTKMSGVFTLNKLKMAVDSAIAYSLDHHIVTAYLYLMHHYEPGDKIIMFGYSRGAFIARVLAGMLEMVGLLNVGLDEMIWMAWKIYEAWEYAAQPMQPSYATTLVEEFRKTFSRNIDIEIEFQGLFDSVNSCGILRDRLFPFTARSGIVRHIRHAVSIDERRGKFKQQSFSPNPYKPNFFSLNYRNYVVEYETIKPRNSYQGTDNHFINHTLGSHPASSRSSHSIQELISRINNFLEVEHSNRVDNFVNQRVEGIFEVNSPPDTFSTNRTSSDLVEKWFPGDHSDVGGSWPPDVTEDNHFLSDISLRWMLSEAVKIGVVFKKGIIHEYANKYTSEQSLLSASHDLLSFKKSSFTMKSPFYNRRDRDYDKDEINRYHGFRLPQKKSWLPWHQNKEDVCFTSFNFTSKSSENLTDLELGLGRDHGNDRKILQRDTKSDGGGNVSIIRVLFWWIAELIPIGIRIENEKCEWKNVYVPNLGRRRNIPEYGELHWSAFWRIKLVDDYRPKNLPNYTVELIDEFEGIPLAKNNNDETKRKVLLRSSLASPLMSYPGVEAESLLPPDGIDDGCNCGRRNIAKLKKQTAELLQSWSENNWNEVPDDLRTLLQQNPDL